MEITQSEILIQKLEARLEIMKAQVFGFDEITGPRHDGAIDELTSIIDDLKAGYL